VADRFCVDLATSLPLQFGEHGVSAEFVLREGEEIPVVLAQSAGDPPPLASLGERCRK
jgi:hypothetical protein